MTPNPLVNIAFGVVVALLVTAIVVLYVATRDRMGTGSEGAARDQTSATRASTSSVASSESESADLMGRVAVVVGDSFSAPGDGAQAAWPDLLGDAAGADVRTYAEAKAAYVARAGTTSMADLEAQAADDFLGQQRRDVTTVLLAGGRFDVGEGSDGRAGEAATELVQQVRADFPSASVVVLSNFASGEPSADGE